MLWIGHREFQVDQDRSELHAFLTEPEELLWAVSIACLPAEYDGLEGSWKPRLYLDTMQLPVRDWRQLQGQAFDFSDRDEDDSFQAGIFEAVHSQVFRNSIRLDTRTADRFRVEWTCLSEVGCFDVGTASPIRAEAEVRFVGVEVHRRDASAETVPAVMETLARYLDLSSLGEPEVFPRSHFWFRPKAV